MKRIVLTLALVVLVFGSQAQMLFHQEAGLTADSTVVSDSLGCGHGRLQRLSLQVGVAGGYSLHLMDECPYISTHGYLLQIPLLLSYDLTPHWRLSTGLRYDFNWDPLKYRVATGYDASGNRTPLAFDTAMHYSSQYAYAFHSYIGVPLEIRWHPVAKEHRLVSLSLDLFAAYAINRYVNIKEWTVNSYNPNALAINTSGSGDVYRGDSMLPWKLEVGLTISTDVIGLIHGVRFFTNLLPTYLEPVSGEKIYISGMVFYL